MKSVLYDVLIFAGAAISLVPLFKVFRLGAILAYLFAGILVGPGVLGWIKDPDVILHFSELGVVLLLFIIGLELAPSKLWSLRKSIFGLGLLQVAVTAAVLFAIGRAMGLSVAVSYVAACGLSLSSTAFALQLLEERRQLKSTFGKGAFGILMFQDIIVVPFIASFTLLEASGESGVAWDAIAKLLVVLLGLVLFSRYLLRYFLRIIADLHIQEIFIACSLFIVIGTGLLMESIGLSMGLGAFLAGVLLANSEYRHELEANLMAFKGLLLGLFFISIGMSLRLDVLASAPERVLLFALLFMTVKAIILWLLTRAFGFPGEASKKIAFLLPQGGEFGYVMFAAAAARGLIDSELNSFLNAGVTLSMLATPFLFELSFKLSRPTAPDENIEPETIEPEDRDVIVIGFGRFGQIVARMLRSANIRHLILDHSATQIETARKFGNKIYYGDASRAEVLHAAGLDKAKILVLAVGNVEKSLQCARLVKQGYPSLRIFARARNRQHAMDLIDLGVERVFRETFQSSLEVAKEVLLAKGFARERINLSLAKFRHHDEEILEKQRSLRHDHKAFISYTTEATKDLEEILAQDLLDSEEAAASASK